MLLNTSYVHDWLYIFCYQIVHYLTAHSTVSMISHKLIIYFVILL